MPRQQNTQMPFIQLVQAQTKACHIRCPKLRDYGWVVGAVILPDSKTHSGEPELYSE